VWSGIRSLLLVVFSLSFHLSSLAHQQSCTEYPSRDAVTWVHTCLISDAGSLIVDRSDVTIALNVLYAGYYRSWATIHAQRTIMPYLNQVWNSWERVISCRRNPSLINQSPVSTLVRSADACMDADKEFQRACRIYSLLMEKVFKEDLTRNKLLVNHLEYIKELATSSISNALIDVRSHIHSLNDFICYKRSGPADLDAENIQRSLWSTIKEKTPRLAFSSFVTSDIGFIKASSYNWRLLSGAQEVGAYIWETTERARASVYLDYYTAAYNTAVACGIMPRCICTEHGLIPTEEIHPPLPCPEYINQHQSID